MVDEIKPRPTFTQCLVNEMKFAYIPYFKWVGIIALFLLVMIGIYVVVLLCPYEVIGQYLKIIPWYVYALLLILSPPCIYACIECLKKRIDKPSVSLAGLILIILAGLFLFIGIVMGNIYLGVMAVTCGFIGFWFI